MRAAALYGVLGPLSLSLAMSALLATPATGRPLAASAARAATTAATTGSAPGPAVAAGGPPAAPAALATRSATAATAVPAWSGSPASAALGATPPGGAAAARGVALAARRAAERGITFRRCPRAEALAAPITCGKVSVPLDYTRPRGKHITLTVSRVRATGPTARHQGALIYNPGGPGASGMAFPEHAAEDAFRRVAAAYDFVGYAPRGVGRSAPLSCQRPSAYAKAPTSSPPHPTAAFKRRLVARARAYVRGCQRRSGSALAHYTTLNNARDLEVLRAALGQRRLTFVGASYGTYYGAVYATLFPGRVRRMVFDSVVDPSPWKIWYRDNLDQSVAFERRWRDWHRWVARHHAVYHLGATADRVLASYEKARRRLGRNPAGGVVGTAQLKNAFLRTGYNDAYWDPAARALAAYLHGDSEPLVALAAPDPAQAAAEENGNAVYTAVECNDAPWPRAWATWDRDNTALARRAPFETWDNVAMNLPCAFWPLKQGRPLDVGDMEAVGPRKGRAVAPPVLLLSAERDAATPYAGAKELWRRLPGSSLVTERKAGTHGLWGGPNDCVNRHVDTYLLTGRTPGRSAFCAPRPEPEPLPEPAPLPESGKQPAALPGTP
ncbi:alpha/beta hydrolase [Streptomyces hygroscopicus]|uniref:alpha/beta hydrolase n=2 Tax=Streptomyces hygroscopicus TaxID=1912 RepID=UPI0024A0CD76|nr:alpha/beta hydrolase [Streptomyces hygroscopicus]GLV74205.1 protease [Streptomyces hygroscopicus subsp. hygroscopicus]